MATGVYVNVPRELRSDLDELDIVVAGAPRGVPAEVLVSISIAGGVLGASADAVQVLLGRSEIARLARRLWDRARRDEAMKIVLEVRQAKGKLDVSFEMTGPDADLAAEVFLRGFAGAFSALLEEPDRDH
jgi:hypothetical protein